ncbi:RNA-binding protein 23/39, partial [Tremellales sp. Uapishka_1]
MSATPPRAQPVDGNRDRTPELTSKPREKRHRDEDERERDGDRDKERSHRRRHRDEETDEEREERRRRRRERDRRERDRSRESHRSHRSHRSRDVEAPAIKEMSREEKERERERRDREMADERREAARAKEQRFAEMDRERRRERQSPPRRRRGSPMYDTRPPPPPPKDPATALLDEVDSESRSVFVSQLASRLTSSDLGLFFEDKLGRGAVRDARVVLDKVSRRSKGIGYVELDAVELVNRALGLSGTVVMGIPINIQLTEAERNRQGLAATGGLPAMTTYTGSTSRPANTYGSSFPPLSTGLAIPQGVDVDAHPDASIPYHRLFVSNIAQNLSADDLKQVFEPFGALDFVDLHLDFVSPSVGSQEVSLNPKDQSGRSKGTAYVQFKDLPSAQMALDAMNEFDLAGRPIRVQTIQERAYVAEHIEDSSGYGTRLDATQRQQLMFKLARTEPAVNLSLSAHRAPVTTKSIPTNPTPFVVVSNMFNPEEETERNWDLDLAEDIKGEVESKYGTVKRLKVEKMSAGEVYIEFDGVPAAEKGIKGLNGRYFGGRRLQASFISETLFKAHL